VNVDRRGRLRRERPNRISAYIGAVVFNAVILVVLHKLPECNLRVLTADYPRILWAVDLSLGVQIAGSFLLIFFHPLYLHYLFNAAFNAVGAVAVWVVYSVFPFRLTEVLPAVSWLESLFKVLLLIGFVASLVSGVLNLYRFIRALLFPDSGKPNPP
jgi:hypothetical protein